MSSVPRHSEEELRQQWAFLDALVERQATSLKSGAQDPEEEMTAALELLRRRCPNPPANRAERDRALGILVRRGYPPELAFDALRRHAGAEAEPDDF